MGFSDQDGEARRWGDTLERKQAELGWKEGIDLRIEYRWAAPQPTRPAAGLSGGDGEFEFERNAG